MTALQILIDGVKARLVHEEGVRDLRGVQFLTDQALAKCVDGIIAHSGSAMDGVVSKERHELCAYLAAHFTALATAAELDVLEDQLRKTQRLQNL